MPPIPRQAPGFCSIASPVARLKAAERARPEGTKRMSFVASRYPCGERSLRPASPWLIASFFQTTFPVAASTAYRKIFSCGKTPAPK